MSFAVLSSLIISFVEHVKNKITKTVKFLREFEKMILQKEEFDFPCG